MSLVLFALLMVSMLTMVAIVIDLGALREVRRSSQSVSDLAALAGGVKLTSGDSVGACNTAFAYLQNNMPALSGATAPPCSGMPVFGTCVDSGSPQTAEYTASTSVTNITVNITYPVVDSDPAMSTVSISAAHDGTACQRLKVSVTRTTPTAFAGVIGVTKETLTASAVVRRFTATTKNVPALWLLDPTNCGSLTAGGGSAVTIGTATVPGLVSVDSAGTSGCGGANSATLYVDNSSSLHAIDNGSISLFATPPGATQCGTGGANDCVQSQINGGQISPQPVSEGQRSTRSPVDWTYNCKSSYPNPVPNVAESPCPNAGLKPAYIDGLRSTLGATPGSPPESGSTVWEQWSSKYPSHPCDPRSNITATLDAGFTGWWIDCENHGGLTLSSGVTVDIPAGNVVLDGGLSVNPGNTFQMNDNNPTPLLPSACTTNPLGLNPPPGPPQNPPFPNLCVDNSSASAAYLFMRSGSRNGDGDMSVSGSLVLDNTSVVQGSTPGGSYTASFGSSGATLRWHGPTDGPLNTLALWSEGVGGYTLTGGASSDLQGVFFTPGAAPFKLAGGGAFSQTAAQFISYDIQITGGGTMTLAPNPNTDVPQPPPAALLIR